MKRIVLILSVFLGLLLVAAVAAWLTLPSLVTVLAGRAIGGQVHVRQTNVSWNDGVVVLALSDLDLSGNVRGSVKKVRMGITVGRGLVITHAFFSDFDVVIGKQRPAGIVLPFSVDTAEIMKGRAVYRGQTYLIDRITVKNINNGKPLQFSLEGRIEGIGRIKTRGEGPRGG